MQDVAKESQIKALTKQNYFKSMHDVTRWPQIKAERSKIISNQGRTQRKNATSKQNAAN